MIFINKRNILKLKINNIKIKIYKIQNFTIELCKSYIINKSICISNIYLMKKIFSSIQNLAMSKKNKMH